MSYWDDERNTIVLDDKCLAEGCGKPIAHTTDMQPDLWCEEHIDWFNLKLCIAETMNLLGDALRDNAPPIR